MLTSEEMNRTVYRLCWFFLCLMPIIIFGIDHISTLHDFFFQPCAIFDATGLYCPGCGGRRAVIALLTGHPLKSLLFHPFVLYFTLCFSLFFISQTLFRLTNGAVKGMNYRNIFVYIGLAVILLQWIIKNMVLLTSGMNYLSLI